MWDIYFGKKHNSLNLEIWFDQWEWPNRDIGECYGRLAFGPFVIWWNR